MTPPHRDATTRYMRMYNDTPVVQNKTTKNSIKCEGKMSIDPARTRASISINSNNSNNSNAFSDESTSSRVSAPPDVVLGCASAGVLSRGLTACQNSKMQIQFLIDE
ncbi:hypothetical protein HDU81_007718 [Chytriomyces hyalinus]|nr:hypothetical protein HDU81_007718 [Chytriomyces hyalinus]